jgi:hypothetical protein
VYERAARAATAYGWFGGIVLGCPQGEDSAEAPVNAMGHDAACPVCRRALDSLLISRNAAP